MLPIPIGTDRHQRKRPWMNILIIATNIVVYMLSHQSGAKAQAGYLAEWWSSGVLSGVDPQLYQFITYQFLHASVSHLLGNMLFLYVFGNNLNEKLGNIGYLAFYLAGGVLAGCGHLLTSETPTLGASGAISAVTGLFFVLLPRTHIRVFIYVIFYVDVLEIPSMYFILLSVLKDIFEPYLMPGSNVAYQAHLAGTLAGFLIGLLLLLTGLVQRDHYDLPALINRYRRRKAYESLVTAGYRPYTGDEVAIPKAVAAEEKITSDPRIYEARERVFAAMRERQLPAAASAYLELRAIDPMQVLPTEVQLDVANQLMLEGKYAAAAGAYEDYLRVYPRAHQTDQVQLMLGLIYANYTPNPARAIELLRAAVARLHSAEQKQLAESELARLSAGGSAAGAPA